MPKASLNCRFLADARNDTEEKVIPTSAPFSVIPARDRSSRTRRTGRGRRSRRRR
jgi:hypothetical protein